MLLLGPLDLHPHGVPPLPACAIREPVPKGLQALLRRAVVDLATAETRRVFPAVVHAGTPGDVVADLELGDQRLDPALRVDVVEALVRRARRPGPPPIVWLTRAGTTDVRDVDLAWLAAARRAAAELGLVLPMAVVTRRAWCDPSTGVGRSWRTRVRQSQV